MGPLKGLKILEVGGIGPGPFCAQMLADLGAQVIRVDRNGNAYGAKDPKYIVWHRSRKSINVDLKKPAGIETILRIIEQSDALIEGFRPGTMEKLGLGPEICLNRNPKLIYGRMTGWGQDGPLSQAAGHDINYIAITGALHAIGQKEETPPPPLNVLGDLGGGGMMLALGIMCALYETQKSGKGQVIDANVVDGTTALMGFFYTMTAGGMYQDKRGSNILDGAAHFYNTYETLDGKYIAVGSIEPQFYELLLKHAGIDDPEFKDQMDQSKWPGLKEKLTEIFKTKTRDQWCQIMEGTDACFSPVLSLEEAQKHPHNIARKTFVEVDGVVQPAPAPRFSRTNPEIQSPPPIPGQDTDKVLADFGFNIDEIETLKKRNVI